MSDPKMLDSNTDLAGPDDGFAEYQDTDEDRQVDEHLQRRVDDRGWMLNEIHAVTLHNSEMLRNIPVRASFPQQELIDNLKRANQLLRKVKRYLEESE